MTLFVEEKTLENTINNLATKASSITKRQAQLIFENAQNFPTKTQVSITIINNGKVSYYGTKKDNDTISTINTHKSVFEIGSISKVFTSTLLADFVVDGKIRLNNNVNDYLKTPFHNNIKIAFTNLANHTSGLPRLPSNLDLTKVNLENPYKEYKEKELKEYLANHLELSNKGEYQYSNLGGGLLG